MLRWIVAIFAAIGLAAIVSKFHFAHNVVIAPKGYGINWVMLGFFGMLGLVLFAKFKK